MLLILFCAWNNANAWQFFVPQFMFKKARQNNNNMSFLFFLYISWSHRKCLLLLWKGKVYKELRLKTKRFHIARLQDIAYKQECNNTLRWYWRTSSSKKCSCTLPYISYINYITVSKVVVIAQLLPRLSFYLLSLNESSYFL